MFLYIFKKKKKSGIFSHYTTLQRRHFQVQTMRHSVCAIDAKIFTIIHTYVCIYSYEKKKCNAH